MNDSQIIDELADVIITTRDFCGNEKEAFVDGCFELGVKSSKQLFTLVLQQVDNQWGNFQKSAGVTVPIDSIERINIEKSLK